jgi:hypothetical protein
VTLQGAARLGIWELQHGDWTRQRGGPPGFWDYLRGEPGLSSALLRRGERENAVTVLRHAVQQSRRFAYPRMVDELLQRSALWPAQVCRDLLDGVCAPVQALSPVPAAPRAQPGDLQLLGFALQYAAALGLESGRQLLRHEQWNVALVDAPIASFLSPAAARPIAWFDPPQREGFLADPFGLQRGDRLTVLCEQLLFADGIGTIASAQPGEGETPDRSIVPRMDAVAIGPPVHLSYPYLIEHDGEIFCVPETHQAREVALYRAESFPERWTKVCTLLDDVAAADSTIFRHGEHWWLACVDEDRGSPTDLFLWHAPQLRGPWTPHRANPVKSDVRSSRPAGTPFWHEGSLYRPAQDCSRTYGGRVAINRVLQLTPERFAEQPVAWVEPDPDGPYPDGLHTLSAVGERTLLDGKRTVFAPQESWRVLARLAGALLGRPTRRRGLRDSRESG